MSVCATPDIVALLTSCMLRVVDAAKVSVDFWTEDLVVIFCVGRPTMFVSRRGGRAIPAPHGDGNRCVFGIGGGNVGDGKVWRMLNERKLPGEMRPEGAGWGIDGEPTWRSIHRVTALVWVCVVYPGCGDTEYPGARVFGNPIAP